MIKCIFWTGRVKTTHREYKSRRNDYEPHKVQSLADLHCPCGSGIWNFYYVYTGNQEKTFKDGTFVWHIESIAPEHLAA